MKSTSTLLCYFIVLTIIVACKGGEDDEPIDNTPKVTELITVNSNFLDTVAPAECWIVVWSSDGSVLDFKKYPGGELKLSTDKIIVGNKISLGIFRYRKIFSRDATTVNVYANISPGMTYGLTTSQAVAPDGTFQLSFNSPLPAGSQLNISSKFGSTGRFSNNNVWTCYRDPRSEKYLLSLRSGGSLTHKLLTDIKANSNTPVHLSELQAFPKTISFNLPTSYNDLSVDFSGFEEPAPTVGLGYVLDDFSSTGPGTSSAFVSGYFNDLKAFSTSIALSVSGKSLRYQKYGSLPSTIDWPDPTRYGFTSQNPKNLLAQASGPFQYVSMSWEFSDSQTTRGWSIMTPTLTPTVGTVPDEILTAHPGFSPDAAFSFVSATFMITSKTYEESVEETISGYAGEYETMRITTRDDH